MFEKSLFADYGFYYAGGPLTRSQRQRQRRLRQRERITIRNARSKSVLMLIDYAVDMLRVNMFGTVFHSFISSNKKINNKHAPFFD